MHLARRASRIRLRAIALAAVVTITGALLGASQLASAQAGAAQPGQPGPKPTIVLEHGAWADASSWDAAIRQHPDHIKHSRLPLVLGTDGAGTVAAVGAQVRGLKVGDEVYSYSWDNPQGGFYAEYVAVPAKLVGSNRSIRSSPAAAT